jgi:ketosteroid isomerase-like protein
MDQEDIALIAAKKAIHEWTNDVNSGNVEGLAMKYYKKNDAELIVNGEVAANTEQDIQNFWNKIIGEDGATGFTWANEKWDRQEGEGVYKRSCDWTSNILHGKVIAEIWEYDPISKKAT